ncbi:hypothetical protein [Carboxylicivirga sp. M1479]|uniref:hypothetical protein n=1 Tax=Carboxylicivirga sp. M1479 TaxID=2594476 RepID=UPI001178157C|nr:hypothetical protein [Carboxylicivirga sp. M1479]TRX64255.1 hypothetical protein FNN09_18010 [Carboxylicivirga sp. M1479]
MNHLILRILFITCAFFTIQHANSQDKALTKTLDEKSNKRIESAEKLISKGDNIVDETKDLQEEVEALQNADGRIKTRKINKRNKKIAQAKVKASLYYQDGYKKYIDVLDDHLRAIEKSGNSIAKQMRDDTKDLERKAKKQYNKAENLSSPDKMIELIELAQSNQQKAIELQTKCILSLSELEIVEEAPLLAEETVAPDSTLINEVVAEEPVIAAADTTSMSPVNETVMAEATPEATTASTPVPATPAVAMGATMGATLIPTASDSLQNDSLLVDEIIEATPLVEEKATQELVVLEEPKTVMDIFLTIQFMADKKPASTEQIESLYSGSKEIIEMNINNWFKYSVGKYQDLEKAKAEMKAENIKGFIVAYNKNQRISVKEAVSLLNGES